MELTGWFAIVPLASPRCSVACHVAGHQVGLVPALWTLFSLVLTILATASWW